MASAYRGASLNPGDTVKIGSVVFVVQLDGVPGDDEMVPYTSDNTADATGDTSSHGEMASDGSGGLEALEPTLVSDVGTAAANEHDANFDPMGILDGPNDSGAADALNNSAIANDIAADLERANRSR